MRAFPGRRPVMRFGRKSRLRAGMFGSNFFTLMVLLGYVLASESPGTGSLAAREVRPVAGVAFEHINE